MCFSIKRCVLVFLSVLLQSFTTTFADSYIWEPVELNNPKLSLIETNPSEISLDDMKIYKFQIRHGACAGTSYFDDCSNDRQRVELASGYRVSLQSFGSKPKSVKRYYRSNLYIPSVDDFPDTGQMHQTIHQVKLYNKNMPVWLVSYFNGGLKIEIESGQMCFVDPKYLPREEWLEVEIYANYTLANEKPKPDSPEYFSYSINGKTHCSFKRPLITKRALDDAGRKQLEFKFGIYNVYPSKWLLGQPENRSWIKENGLKLVAYEQDSRGQSNGVTRSDLATPFDYDWPVKLPTQTLYYTDWVVADTYEGLGVSRFSEIKEVVMGIQDRLLSDVAFEDCVIENAKSLGVPPDRIKKAIARAKRGLSKPIERISNLLEGGACN